VVWESEWAVGAGAEVLGAVWSGLARGSSGKFSAASAGCAFATGPAKSTANGMNIAANHRVRANRSTSILLRKPIAQTGQRGLSLIRAMQILHYQAGSEASLNPPTGKREHETVRAFRQGEGRVSEALRTCFNVRVVRVKSVGPHKGRCFPTEPLWPPGGADRGTALLILWQNPRSGREIEEMLMA
jgi:hypothetical protein